MYWSLAKTSGNSGLPLRDSTSNILDQAHAITMNPKQVHGEPLEPRLMCTL